MTPGHKGREAVWSPAMVREITKILAYRGNAIYSWKFME
jgi:hypothetical protein